MNTKRLANANNYGGISVFGINPDNGADPIIFVSMIDEHGEIIGDRLLGVDAEFARGLAKILCTEADAVDAGERPISRDGAGGTEQGQNRNVAKNVAKRLGEV